MRYLLTLGAAWAAACSAEPQPDRTSVVTPAAEARQHPAAQPCAITGISSDVDPAGLRVRERPDIRSRVVGLLHPGMDPHVFFHEDKPSLAEGLVGAQFTVTEVSGDWLRIADVDPITDGLAPDGSLEARPNFQGEGWVHASRVQLLAKGLAVPHALPEEGSAAVDPREVRPSARIVGCEKQWAKVTDEETTGWVRSESNREHAAKLRDALRREAGAR